MEFPVKPEALKCLDDILNAAEHIVTWTRGLNEHRLWADKLIRSGVERQYEIIAEALRRLRVLDRWVFGKITDPEVVIRLGDAILRDYDAIDYGIIYRSIASELPALVNEVASIRIRVQA